ncbi:MBL fold metallo-hydrolase [Desulfonema magnum]|uniref:hydroxyacylglutathione hydrolase n=1 Tax=Desulfonema magnum TaxID=45655 RepID=A0A975GQD2_9BACT|nr:MBL fold metallo-hydrolase [Desulfonema magnum]QTA89759.1 Beta-lactamase domain-containing protein [Desulfonema magnum]
MKVRQLRYSSDNFTYLIYDKRSALAIDAGAVEAIFSFISEHDLRLDFVANTHSHPDHTTGTRTVLDRSGARFLDNKTLRDTGTIEIEGNKITVYHTPGHTADSLCFHLDKTLITGDTLFNGTVGNCFSGDVESFFNSVKLLTSFHKETIIYAGHDYVHESMIFARHLEPDNKNIDTFLEKYDPNHVYSTLDDEFKINPYLRFNDEKIIAILKKQGLSVKTEYDRWRSLMTLG